MYSHQFAAPTPQAAAEAAGSPNEEVRLPLWLTDAEIEFLMGLCLIAPRSDESDAGLLRRLIDAWQGIQRK